MAFEIYHRRSRDSKVNIPGISLSKNSLVLNKVTRELLNISPQGSGFVELAFDKDEKTIRIRPTEDSNGNLKIKKTKLPAKDFRSQFGINQTGKFQGTFSNEDKAVYVKLSESA